MPLALRSSSTRLNVASYLDILTADGADSVQISSSKTAALSVRLGAGDDTVRLTNVRGTLADIDGGDGHDLFYQQLGSTMRDGWTLHSIEPRLRTISAIPYTGW